MVLGQVGSHIFYLDTRNEQEYNMSDKQLQSAWETLNTHVKQLKGRIREQENTIKQLREELSKAKQVEANTKWVEHDDKGVRL